MSNGVDGVEGANAFDCLTCGACCSYDASWPRFSTESDDALDLIPAHLVADNLSGMKCNGVRCVALDGVVGERVKCTIHAVRPDVCRACMPGDDECLLARRAHNIGSLGIGEVV